MEQCKTKIGPFICEFCDSVMKTLKARSAIVDGKCKAIGYCKHCGCDTWTKEVEIPEEMIRQYQQKEDV